MIFFLVPVFNEEKNIPNLCRELSGLTLTEEFYFVFSDDGSSDSSKQIIQELFPASQFVILGDGINRGPGAAFNAGFEWILQQSKFSEDRIVTLEADGTSDLSILPVMLALNKMNYDLVLASVYAQGGGFDQTSFYRKFTSAVANFLFRFLFDVQVLTLSSFYRVYSISLLKKVKAKHHILIKETGFICMLEILVKSLKSDAKVIEVPMKLHSSKRQGQSKMKVFKTTLQYFKFLFKNRD
ncbi:MAG: glycosyltransferase [Cyclobacteriaceae bacterium]|nr:glycosyltransferase [Cyclobacteriaceae bacterium]